MKKKLQALVELGRKLKEVREERGMDYLHAGAKCGYRPGSYANIELGNLLPHRRG